MIALILTFARLLLPLIPTAEQKQQAQQAIADQYIRFLQTTDNSLYAVVRSLEILGALWDVFFNGGRMWAQAAASIGSTPYGFIELLVLLWPFFGNVLSPFVVPALQAALKASSTTVVPPSKEPVSGPTTMPPQPPRSIRYGAEFPSSPVPDAGGHDK